MNKRHFAPFIFLLFFLSFEHCFGTNIQWFKYLGDTTKKYPVRNYIIQGLTTDSSNNIYYCFAKNAIDTNISIIRKISPDGEILWEKCILPFGMNDTIITRLDRNFKLYIDNDHNLQLVASGYDTTGFAVNGFYQRFVLLKKWDSDGVELAEYKKNLTCQTLVGWNADISDVKIRKNGDIYLSHCFNSGGEYECNIRGYDKFFNPIFIKDFTVANIGNESADHEPIIAVNDTCLNICYSTYQFSTSKTNIRLVQLSLVSGDTNWTYVKQEDSGYYAKTQIEILDNTIYTAGWSLEKFSLKGDFIATDRNHRIGNFVFDSISHRLYASGRTAQQYKLLTFDTSLNLMNTSSPVIPNVPSSAWWVSLKDSFLYLYGGGIDTPANVNQRYLFLSKFNLDGILLHQTVHTIPSGLGYVAEVYPQVVDNDGNVIILSELFMNGYTDTLGHHWMAAPLYMIKINYDNPNNLSGHIYADVNSNCMMDNNEEPVESNLMHLLPEDIYSVSDSNGFYSFRKQNGTGNVECIPYSSNINSCVTSNSYSMNVANGASLDTLDFGLILTSATDGYCKIAGGVSRPGFIQKLFASAGNLSSHKLYNRTTHNTRVRLI